MTVPPYAVAYVVTLLVSWSADYFNAYVFLFSMLTDQKSMCPGADTENSRGVHSALFALIGAIGFIVSAVLPPDAYSVRQYPELQILYKLY